MIEQLPQGGQHEQMIPRQRHNEEQIREGIEQARTEERVIDHRTARLIAEQLYGPDSPLQRLAATGEVCLDQDDVSSEGSFCVLTELASLTGAVPDKHAWLEALAGYALTREESPQPVRGWRAQTDDPVSPERTDCTPQIFVASSADMHAGQHVGLWIDADQEPEALEAEIRLMLDQSRHPEASAWEIFDFTGFASTNAFGLVDGHEHSTLERISRVAQGVAEHGPAFAAYVGFAGTDRESCEQFERRYYGRWNSLADYARHVADELEWYSYLALVPGWMRDYVTLDYDKLAAHLTQDLTIVDGSDGRIYIFMNC